MSRPPTSQRWRRSWVGRTCATRTWRAWPASQMSAGQRAPQPRQSRRRRRASTLICGTCLLMRLRCSSISCRFRRSTHSAMRLCAAGNRTAPLLALQSCRFCRMFLRPKCAHLHYRSWSLLQRRPAVLLPAARRVSFTAAECRAALIPASSLRLQCQRHAPVACS